jgi:hypothetical protein
MDSSISTPDLSNDEPLEPESVEPDPVESKSLDPQTFKFDMPESNSLEPNKIMYELRDHICDIKPLTETQLYNIKFLSDSQKIEIINLYNKIIIYVLQFMDL